MVLKHERKTELSKRRKTANEKKLRELKYTKGPSAYGSVQNLQQSTNLKTSLVKLFLENKKCPLKALESLKKFINNWNLLPAK